jgi:hypothetical protein
MNFLGEPLSFPFFSSSPAFPWSAAKKKTGAAEAAPENVQRR